MYFLSYIGQIISYFLLFFPLEDDILVIVKPHNKFIPHDIVLWFDFSSVLFSPTYIKYK